jgi:hypothetical protein
MYRAERGLVDQPQNNIFRRASKRKIYAQKEPLSAKAV